MPTEGDRIDLDDASRHHLERVLRYPIGGQVSYTDGVGLLGDGTLDKGAVIRGEETMTSRPTRVSVAVAPPHDTSRMRFLVEKLSELGVVRLVWLRTTHGEGRPPKPEKATAWARAALEQSRGAWLTEIGDLTAIGNLSQLGTPIFADPGGVAPAVVARITDPVLCVGPEGGFGPDEIPVGTLRVSLGATILRVETAAVTGAALLGAAGDNLVARGRTF